MDHGRVNAKDKMQKRIPNMILSPNTCLYVSALLFPNRGSFADFSIQGLNLNWSVFIFPSF